MPVPDTPSWTHRTIAVPVLHSDRLVMRAFDETDLDAYVGMMSDPEVARFVGDGLPLNRTGAWRQIAMILGHWALRGFGLWAVEERATGALVGRIGLIEPAGWPGFELAYTVARPSWGRGYAREGAGAALTYAQSIMGREEIISVIRPDNIASIRVASALGAVRGETIQFLGAPSDVYRYPARLAGGPLFSDDLT